MPPSFFCQAAFVLATSISIILRFALLSIPDMLAMMRSPRQLSNLRWSVNADGSVKHTYSRNQIVAALQEARQAETTSDTLTTSIDDEPDARRPSGGGGRAFGDDVTNLGQQGEEGTVQVRLRAFH